MTITARLIAKRDNGRRKTREWSGPIDEEYTELCQTLDGVLPGQHRREGVVAR